MNYQPQLVSRISSISSNAGRLSREQNCQTSRLCRSNEIYGMKHLLVGTEAQCFNAHRNWWDEKREGTLELEELKKSYHSF